jgi:hypothetical protein
MIRLLCKAAVESVILLALLYGSFFLAVKVLPMTKVNFSIGSGVPGQEACVLSVQFEKIQAPPPAILKKGTIGA